MVKCLNIGKNIGNPIYRSISSPDVSKIDQKHQDQVFTLTAGIVRLY